MIRTIALTLATLSLIAGGPGVAARPVPDGSIPLDVLFTSDVHGHVDPGSATFLNPEFPPPLGGGASAATYIARVRAEAARDGRTVLLFDCGDMFQGTPLGAHTKGATIVEWMGRMRYDAATLGNHDFDFGRDNAERLARMAAFPMLVANLFDRATSERVPWVRDHVAIEMDGIRIAVLGYITESTVNMAFERNIAGLEFRPVVDQIQADVDRVRAGGADLVFVLLHHGLPYRLDVESEYRRMLEREAAGQLRHFGMDAMELAHVVRGVDVIFSGHTHQGYERPWQDPLTHTLVVEPYGNGSSLGHLTLTIDRATRSLIGFRTHFDRGSLLTLLEDEVWPDTTEGAWLETRVAEAERGLEIEVGRTRVALTRGAADDALMGFVLADAFREELEADFAIQNTGGVRADLSAGPITERDVLAVSPFGNQMVLARVSGATLRDLIEDRLAGRGGGLFISGGRVRYDPTRPDGQRLVEFTIGGVPLDTARVYRVAMTDYLAEGNSGLGRLKSLPQEAFLPEGITDRQALSNYIRRLKVLEPRNDGRWSRVGR
jgi:5'-nucleotidase / UDP-sugar diphosphatase